MTTTTYPNRTGFSNPSKDSNGLSLEPVSGGGLYLPNGLSSAVLGTYTSWKATVAAILAGQGFGDWLKVGDSTTWGQYALSSSTNFPGNFARNPVQYSAFALSQAGLYTTTESSFGEGGIGPTNMAAYDPRMTYNSWASSTSESIGGFLTIASAVTSTTITPNTDCDTWESWDSCATHPGTTLGTITYAGAPGSPLSINPGPYSKTTVVSANGPTRNPIGYAFASGLQTYHGGFRGWNSQKPCLRAINAGRPGALAGTLAVSANPWSPLNAYLALTPSIAGIELGINDWNAATPIPTYTANIQAIVSNFLNAKIPCYLVSPFPSQNSAVATTTQAPYVAALKAIAAANNIAFFDKWTSLMSWEVQTGFGWFANSVHPQFGLYQQSGQSEARLLLTLGT